METYLFEPDDVEETLDIPSVIEVVENAFEKYQQGDAQMPPKSYIDLPQYNGDFRAMPSYVGATETEQKNEPSMTDVSGLKWVNSHPDNPDEHGLPSVMGVMIYNDPETAFPLAVMDGTTLTKYRTGGATGVGTRHLSRKDASTFGIVGAGAQAYAQLDAVAHVRDIERVVVNDINQEAVESFIDDHTEAPYEVLGGTTEQAAGCDIVSTTTPSRKPIVEREWVEEGTHINAMGADAEGKQELDPDIIREGQTVIDDWEQCSHSGEINEAVSSGEFGRGDVCAELGAVVTGEALGRQGEKDITVFDSTGLAIQDSVTARLVNERGRDRGVGTPFELIDS